MTRKAAATGRVQIRLGVLPAASLRAESYRQDARILAARGLTAGQIAEQLGVHRVTVAKWLGQELAK